MLKFKDAPLLLEFLELARVVRAHVVDQRHVPGRQLTEELVGADHREGRRQVRALLVGKRVATIRPLVRGEIVQQRRGRGGGLRG